MLQSLLRCGTTLRYNSNSTIPKFGSHCSYCGTSWGSDQANTNSTRICHKCNQVTYSNPIPVMVGLLYKKNPLEVLVIRRGIPPFQGDFALVGGFLETADTWNTGLSREFEEEVGIPVPSHSWKLQEVFSPGPNVPRLLIFAHAPCPEEYYSLDKLTLDPIEVKEAVWTKQPVDLCFSSHTDALTRFFGTFKEK